MPKGLGEQVERQRIVIAVQITDAIGKTRTERALIDSGAEENCMQQALAIECGWEPKDSQIKLATVEGKEVVTYGTHSIDITTTDSEKTTKTHRHDFVACEFDVPDISMILGFPWLRDTDPAINFATRTWRHPSDTFPISLLTAKRFRKVMKKETVYCVTVKALTDETTIIPNAYKDFADVFSEEAAGVLPEHHPMEHRIDLEPGKNPPWGPVYPLAESELKTLREYLDTSLQKGWIRRSTSPAGAPILFIPKKTGGLRLCVDYRGLNAVTIKNRTPLPLISETLDRFGKAKIYTKLDLKDAYHRLHIKEGDEWKTAFRTRYGHFEYCVLPFGLSNAPATFQAYINQALIGLVDVIYVVYLDDILIFSENVEEHEEAVRKVLERLRSYQLFANLKKCVFGTDMVEFLGFIIGPSGINMDPSRIAAIKDWPLPTSIRDIQVFLGFTNFYRRFIRSYSRVVGALTDLLKAKTPRPFRLTPDAIAAFKELKYRFTHAPILRHFDPSKRIIVETDASAFAIGGILSQLFGEGSEARWHPIAFYSKKLSPVEQRYEVHDGELMAIVFAFKQWGQYLRGASDTITVRSDHNNLKYFMTKRVLSGRQARWAESLAEFDFVIEYRAGKTNPADGPSRRPDHRGSEPNRCVPEEEEESCLPTLHNKLRVMGLAQLNFVYTAGRESERIANLTHNGTAERSECVNPKRDTRETELRHLRTGQLPGLRLSRHYMQESWAKNHRNGVIGVCPSLEPVAGIAGCKQRVPRKVAIGVLSAETIYGAASEPIHSALLELQRSDPFVTDGVYESYPTRGRIGSEGHWRVDEEGLLRYKGAVYVPAEPAIRSEVIHIHHDDETAGHFGLRRTLELIRRKYFWQSLRRDVKRHIQSCGVCQRSKTRRHRPYGELAPIPIPTKP